MAAGVAKACAPQGSAWKEIRPWSKSRRSTPDGTLASPAKLAVTRTTQAMRCGHTVLFLLSGIFQRKTK